MELTDSFCNISLSFPRLGQDKPGGPPTQSLMGIRAPPALPQSPIPSHIGSPFLDHPQGELIEVNSILIVL